MGEQAPEAGIPGETPGGVPGNGRPSAGDVIRHSNDVVTEFREGDDGEIHSKTTIFSQLPDPIDELLKQHDIQLKFQNPEIRNILLDQSADMVSTDGCMSSPGGPSC